MKRYSIELTAMQWGLIAIDLGSLRKRSDSTEALAALIKLILDHVGDQDIDLPYNIKDRSDAVV